MTFDEGYGSKPDFLRGLECSRPEVRGRGPSELHRLAQAAPRDHASRTTRTVEGEAARSLGWPAASRPAQAGSRRCWRSRWLSATKPGNAGESRTAREGPMIWEVKQTRCFTPKDEDGMPGEALHLMVARNVLDPKEVKFFVSNAPPKTPVSEVVAGGLFEMASRALFRRPEERRSGWISTKGRRYQGLKRHLILSCVSYLFLSRCEGSSGGKNPELTECQVHTAIAAMIPYWWLEQRPSKKLLERTAEEIARTQRRNAAARKSHTKATRKKLRALGIKLTEVPAAPGERLSAVVLDSAHCPPPAVVARSPDRDTRRSTEGRPRRRVE